MSTKGELIAEAIRRAIFSIACKLNSAPQYLFALSSTGNRDGGRPGIWTLLGFVDDQEFEEALKLAYPGKAALPKRLEKILSSGEADTSASFLLCRAFAGSNHHIRFGPDEAARAEKSANTNILPSIQSDEKIKLQVDRLRIILNLEGVSETTFLPDPPNGYKVYTPPAFTVEPSFTYQEAFHSQDEEQQRRDQQTLTTDPSLHAYYNNYYASATNVVSPDSSSYYNDNQFFASQRPPLGRLTTRSVSPTINQQPSWEEQQPTSNATSFRQNKSATVNLESETDDELPPAFLKPVWPKWHALLDVHDEHISYKNGAPDQRVVIPNGYKKLVHCNHHNRVIAKADKYDKVIKRLQRKLFRASNERCRRLLGAVMATFASLVVVAAETLLATWTFCLLKYVLEIEDVTIEQAINSSPSRTVLNNWVTELAVDQTIAAANEIDTAEAVYIAFDHGDEGACVKRLYWMDAERLIVKKFTLDVDVAGKTANEIAKGVLHSFGKLFLSGTRRLNGQCSDSGGAGLESVQTELVGIGVAVEDGYFVTSCMLHNLQSGIREPIKQLLGEGGIDNRTAMQVMHALYDLQKSLSHELLLQYLQAAWIELHGLGVQFPQRLQECLPEPILTRWWSVCVAALHLTCHWEIILFVVATVCKLGRTSDAFNKIASGLHSLMKEDMVYSDLCLLADFHTAFLNRHFKWLQRADPAVGEPGFLTVHVLHRYFLMHRDLNALKTALDEGDRNRDSIALFLQSIDKLQDDPAEKDGERYMKAEKQALQRRKFVLFLSQVEELIDKHCKRFCEPPLLLLAALGESAIARPVAQYILSGGADFDAAVAEEHESHLHSNTFDIKELKEFLSCKCCTFTAHDFEILRDSVIFERFGNIVTKIAEDGIDIWDNVNPAMAPYRKTVLVYACALPSSNHDAERTVKRSKYIAKTGRQEKNRSIYSIAGNNFISESRLDDDEESDTDNALSGEDGSDKDSRQKRGIWRGPEKTLDIFNKGSALSHQLEDIKTDLGPDEYKQR